MVLYSLVIDSPFFCGAKVWVFFIPAKYFRGKLIKLPTFFVKLTFLPLFSPFLHAFLLSFFYELNTFSILLLKQTAWQMSLKVGAFSLLFVFLSFAN